VRRLITRWAAGAALTGGLAGGGSASWRAPRVTFAGPPSLVLQSPGQPAPDSLAVTVDSQHHTIALVEGPFHVPAMDPSMSLDAMEHNTTMWRFEWPIDGWIHGFRIAVEDGRGGPLPRRMLHHLVVANFSRRALIYPMFERLMGAGGETADGSIPATAGIPMRRGMRLGMYVGWHNEADSAFDGVYVRLTFIWTPRHADPEPISFLPAHLDVHEVVGVADSYDLPPGHSEMSYEFRLPVGGRLLGMGGHMHDYGVSVRLEDIDKRRIVSELHTSRDESGRVLGVSRQLFGLLGPGKKLYAGRRYRIVGVFDNPTGQTIVEGGMANMLGLFVPDDWRRLPPVDLSDPVLQRDLSMLESFGHPGGHEE